MARRIAALMIAFSMFLQQAGFAQVALDPFRYLNTFQGQTAQELRLPHLRNFSLDRRTGHINLLLDKGDFREVRIDELAPQARNIYTYFLIGLALPNNSFWVNLRPDSPDKIIDEYLEQTDMGKILLEADVQLKKDTASFTSLRNAIGKAYWDKLYKKAGEIFGTDNITIPTLTRPWIVPDEVVVSYNQQGAFVYKATLKVMLEQDHLKGQTVYSFSDPRQKELNEYAAGLVRQLIIPELTKLVNNGKAYAKLRQVYYSLILAQWFKANLNIYKTPGYLRLANSRNLSGLTSNVAWSKQKYFQQYKQSFDQGEYNIKEQHSGITGRSMRTYFSGGINLDVASSPVSVKGSFELDKASKALLATGQYVSYSPESGELLGGPSLGAAGRSASSPMQVTGRAKESLDFIRVQFDAMAKELAGQGATHADIQDLTDRMQKAQEFLARISERLASRNENETIHPEEANIRVSEDQPAVTPNNRVLRIGIYPVAGNPLHWDHLLVALEAIAMEGLDKVIFDIQSGKDTRKPILGATERYRYELCQLVLKNFAPFFGFSENVSPDGETDIFRILKLNPSQKIDAFYIVGGDHYNRWAKAEAPDGMLRGTPEYEAWVQKNGRQPNPDTIQKLEDNPDRFGMDRAMHSVSALFADRPGEVQKAVAHNLKNLKQLPSVGAASATAIRNALQGLANGADPRSLSGLVYLPRMSMQYIQEHPEYLDMLVNPDKYMGQASSPMLPPGPARNALDFIRAQFNEMARELVDSEADYRDVPGFSERMNKAERFLAKIAERLASADENEAIHPEEANIRVSADQAAVAPNNRVLRIGIYPVAGNPLHWDHLLVALQAIAEERLDKVIFDIQSGKDSRKPELGASEPFRYGLSKLIFRNFAPFFGFSENISQDGETDIFRILSLNPGQKIDAFYIVGGDHYNRWAKAEASDGMLRGTAEYQAWAQKNGRYPSRDTIQKLEDKISLVLGDAQCPEVKQEDYGHVVDNPYGLNTSMHSVSALFADRPGEVQKVVNHSLKNLRQLPSVGAAAAREIREAFQGMEQGKSPSTLPGLVYLPHTSYLYIQAHRHYLDMLVNPDKYKKASHGSSPISQDLGGIDFRNIPITAQFSSVNLLKPPIELLPRQELAQAYQDIQSMINSGIAPSDDRVWEYVYSVYKNAGSEDDLTQAMVCVTQVLSLEERLLKKSDPGIMQSLAVLELKGIPETATAALDE